MKSVKQRLKWYQRVKALPVAVSLLSAIALGSVEPVNAKVEQTIWPEYKTATSSLTTASPQQPL